MLGRFANKSVEVLSLAELWKWRERWEEKSEERTKKEERRRVGVAGKRVGKCVGKRWQNN